IVFTDGEDTEGGYSINQIIEEACMHNVRIFTVGLSNGVNDRVLSEIAFETNGAVMLAEEAEQLIAQYSSLGQLLHGEAQIYRIRMSVRKNSGASWYNGNLLSSVISLELSEDYTIRFPIERYIVENPICN
ncbi:MAG: VWA domain-containing protein, partial [Chitinophagales bacterium]